MSDPGTQQQSGSLFYTRPLQVVLPPLSDSIADNMNIVDMDKEELSKELNVSGSSDTILGPTSGDVMRNLDNTQSTNSNNDQETEGSMSVTSAEKQEWSVTLYDVDSKGSVSEEDLARLVTMLYKAAGHSITSKPEHTSKKIKLRLSVAPDPPKVHHSFNESLLSPPTEDHRQPSSPPKYINIPNDFKGSKPATTEKPRKEAKNSQRREQKSARRRLEKIQNATGGDEHENDKENVANGGAAMKLPSTDTGESDTRPRHRVHRKRHKKRKSMTTSSPVEENKDRRKYYEHLMGIENECLEKSSGKHSTPSTDAAPIASNNKHPGSNPFSQDNRRVLESHHKAEHFKTDQDMSPKPETVHSSYRHSHNKHSTNKVVHFLSSAVNSSHKPRNVQFEQCEVQKSSSLPTDMRISHHKKHLSSKIKNSFVVNPFQFSQHKTRGCQLTVQDLLAHQQGLEASFDEQLESQLDKLHTSKQSHGHVTAVNVDTGEKHFVSSPYNDTSILPERDMGVFGEGDCPTQGISPHQLRRHRHREQDHMRAMRQVAAWIQQQPNIHQDSRITQVNKDNTTTTAPTQVKDKKSHMTTTSGSGNVLRHEHHHYHTHHHHYHFYHYYET